MIGMNKALQIVIAAAAVGTTAGYVAPRTNGPVATSVSQLESMPGTGGDSTGWRMKPKKYAASKSIGDSHLQGLGSAAPAAPAAPVAAAAPAYSAAPAAAAAPVSNSVITPGGGWRMKPKKYAASKSIGDEHLQSLNGNVAPAAAAAAPAYSAVPAASAAPAAAAAAPVSNSVITPDGGWRMKPKKYAASKSIGDEHLQSLNGNVAPAAAAAAAASPAYSAAPAAAAAAPVSNSVITPDGGWRMKPKKYAASKSIGDEHLQSLNGNVAPAAPASAGYAAPPAPPAPVAPAAPAAPVSHAISFDSVSFPDGGWRMKPKKYAAS
eukprot:CAMPEP_0197840024 /NCGR_PEP_ID=MMETSP1437-20131217/45366_1 /TAXON_ID=49252 ORGANISM="Eucampia antarctica, Strain CCMP1452" /NCGR_SAMPLE_ID=MMETSP1437 /ASSEMBLY_ACC=CAM_ASM_001096 /LENGTH=321 /DNA_ID=CAMNT_0043449569 /DNA_START=60 /DNA_END=1021 /DNA_ORIENTATION=-